MYIVKSHCEHDGGMIIMKNHETLVHVDEGQRNYLDYFDVNFQ
jgi:hypothetical protein